jgi:glycosyltransferase involved in cell wall biosynthesis
MAKILIIGRLPPPVGGVTTYLKRLTNSLRHHRFAFSFCDIQKDSWADILLKIARHRIIHIHFSNPAAQLLFALLCRASFKKLIITYHGKWGRYGLAGNIAVKLSARFAHVPIVQEHASMREAMLCNSRSQLVSTYISDSEITPLSAEWHTKICKSSHNYQATFCTNAWNVVFDKNGREIYGISDLIKRFAVYPEYRLLISDPSGNYRSYIKKHIPNISENILLINHLHDFRSVLMLSDAFIRNTTTDGVSLSIHEAHELKIPVLASAAVDRPIFCSVFKDFLETDLKEKFEEAKLLAGQSAVLPDPVGQLIKLYRNIENEIL